MPETWDELINDALVEIGVLEDGEDPDAGQLKRGLTRLQRMLDEWAVDGLLVPAISHSDHSCKTAKQKYTIGAAADSPDIVGDAPTTIEALTFKRQGERAGRPLVELSYIVWTEQQSPERTWPSGFYYSKSYPVAEILFDASTLQGDSFRISGRTFLTGEAIAGQDDTGTPRGYNRGIMYNLAVEIAASYGVKKALSDETKRHARDGKNSIRNRNIGQQTIRLDNALVLKDTGALMRGSVSWRS